MCGVAVGTVKSRANRGRKRLAELMDLDDSEAPNFADAQTLAVMAGRPAA